MANWNDERSTSQGLGPGLNRSGDLSGVGTTFDAGLRQHMLSIYNYMASGVLLTGIIALLFERSPLFAMAFSIEQTARGAVLQPNLLGWLVVLSPLAVMLFWWFGAKNASTGTLKTAFWAYCVSFGLSSATLVFTYTDASLALAFVSTAAAFAGLSLYGYTTQRSLSGLGTFLVMGVVGLIVAMLLNAIFIQSAGFSLVISGLGVLIFAGLTAYDTQKLKHQYAEVRGTEWQEKAVIFGALNLYLDFINMFLFILRLLGDRR